MDVFLLSFVPFKMKKILDEINSFTNGLDTIIGERGVQLSGGQKQRLSIAVALINDPKVLFLDEPTTGLDPQARRNMWKLIKDIRSEGKTIILTTHYMEEAEELCDRVAIIDTGKIISIDTPNNLILELLNSGFKGEHKIKDANLEDVFLNLTGKNLRED